MTSKRYTKISAGQLEGFQHAHDDYWCRPLVFGSNLFTYLAYVPPGGFMPDHGHEEDPYELSFYLIQGQLELTMDGDTFTVAPGDAVHVQPTVSLGVRNNGTTTAVFHLTFNPPPPNNSLEAMRKRVQARGTKTKTPAEMEDLLKLGR
jgi:quercetin dioxygenase-like cupin family protein